MKILQVSPREEEKMNCAVGKIQWELPSPSSAHDAHLMAWYLCIAQCEVLARNELQWCLAGVQHWGCRASPERALLKESWMLGSTLFTTYKLLGLLLRGRSRGVGKREKPVAFASIK